MAEDNKEKKQPDSIQEDEPFYSLPNIYFNAVKVNRSKYDFQIIFGQALINPFLEKPLHLIKPLVLAQTSPQHLKAAIKVLESALADYEKEFGKVPDVRDKKTKE